MKISVIIPCYNVEKLVSHCLDSVLNQTIGRGCLEIILVDDASTDGTVEVLKTYEAKYPENIMLILCEENGHQGRARNIGLTYATGDYICFVDSDDWIRKDMLAILSQIAERTNPDLIQFRYTGKTEYCEDENLTELPCGFYEISTQELRRQLILSDSVLNESCTTKLYRKELLLESGVRFAENCSYEEPLFTFPLKFYAERIAVIEAPLYYYRYNPNGTTASYMKTTTTLREHLLVQEQVLEFMRNSGFMKEYRDEIECYFVHTCYAEMFFFCKYRNVLLPVELFREMAQTVERECPNYAANPYWREACFADEVGLLGLITDLKGKTAGETEDRLRLIIEELSA